MMKKRFFTLLLTGVLMTFSATAQEKRTDPGYWVLSYQKTFLEGEYAQQESTGLIGGSDGLAEFRVFHYIPASFKPDGTYTVENRPDVTHINMGGQRKPEQRNTHRVSVTWSRPPQYVAIGEENKIALDVGATIDGSSYSAEQLAKDRMGGIQEGYTTSMEVGVMPKIVLKNTTIGFSLMQQVLIDSNTAEDIETNMERILTNAGSNGDELDEAMEQQYGGGERSAEWDASITDKASGTLMNDEPWELKLKLGEESYMMVIVSTRFFSRTAFKTSTYEVVQYYLYKYGGEDVDVTTRADDKDKWIQPAKTDSISQGGDDDDEGGEDKGTFLPPWVIPVAVSTIGVAVGYKILQSRKKKEEEEQPKGDKPKDKPDGKPYDPIVPPVKEPDKNVEKKAEEGTVPVAKPEEKGNVDSNKKEPSTYKMILYKEFGNSLAVGDEPRLVGARIEEITAKGEKIHRADLTAQIEIVQGNGITIVETGMYDKYRAASIRVEEPPKKEPWEGDVWFIFRAPGGALRNRVVFNIEDGKIRFKQDNLTLPARYEKEVRLPFIVMGMNDGTADIKATILDEHDKETKDYSVKTEWNEKEQCYYAIIKDQVLDPKVDEGIAGNYLGFTLSIEARKEPSRLIKGYLPIYRYYMGLVMRMNGNVNCFLEEFNPSRHDPKLKKTRADGTEVAPAQQECYLKLYDFDEETNKLLIIDPQPLSVKWVVKGLDKHKVMSDMIGRESIQMGLDAALAGAGLGAGIGSLVSDAHSQAFGDLNVAQQRLIELQQQLDALGLAFKAKWQDEGDGRICYLLRCVKGVLNAPNRFDAEMEITAEHKDKVYSFKRMVHLLSQPKRKFASVEDSMAALKQDNKITEGLWEIEGGIQAAGITFNVAPLLYFVRMQLDFYDSDYGYDERNIKAIQKVYLNTLERQAQEDRVEAEAATACDNLQWYQLDWWLQRSLEGHEYLEKMPLALRIGFAVASLGFTEIVFDVPYEMKKYVDEGGESVGEGFVVGATVAVKAWAIEAAITLGVGAIGVGLKAAGKGIGTAAKGATGIMKATTKESLKAGGKVAKEVMKDSLKVMKETMKTEVCTGLKSWAKKQISWEVGALEKAIAKEAKALLASVKNLANGSKYAAAEAFAKQQAIQNIENLQTMIEMCRWKPTVENVRLRNQLIMKCQADKQTMTFLKKPGLLADDPLLKGVDLQILKRDFNGLLQKMYKETDDLVKCDLAIAGKISPDKIRTFGATSSSADDLITGASVTFDRDVTYYYVLNGKPHYFSQAYVDQLYAKHFRNVVNSHTLPPNMTGFNPSQLTPQALKRMEEMEAKQAAIATRLYDQTVVEDILHHPESYGEDLGRMIDKELYGEALKNPAKVAEAVLHKGTSRFDYADLLWAQAEAADGIVKKQILQARAVSEMMEGCRQINKVFKLISGRDAVRHTFSKLPRKLRKAVELLEPLNGVSTTLSEVETALAQEGYTFRSLSQAVSDAVFQVG